MRIVVAGAGRGGLSLAIHLQSRGHAVTIVERDAVIAGRASEEHGIVALVGDATDTAIIRQADIGRADALLAMLHRDADNLALAMLARSLGAKRVIVRMRDPEYRSTYERAGIQQILSETEILVGALATAIEFEAVKHSMVLGSGEAIAVELAIEPGAWVVGRPVSEVATHEAFPRSCVIAGLTSGGTVQAPRGATVIEEGTQLLLVCARKDLNAAIDFFLGLRMSTVAAKA
jgi:trk system potassium uptake protein TrkA